ncbi:hypothetical protein EV132_13616 [Rhizobium sullae]|uniref:Uncharacterized protein n=1 Tax=Rhizobium sullae TaxID=50338 RepID=A0A4R3PZ65_RHISU|nr:hypothetical protein EV132_13616 [Rhizobium sullae]
MPILARSAAASAYPIKMNVRTTQRQRHAPRSLLATVIRLGSDWRTRSLRVSAGVGASRDLGHYVFFLTGLSQSGLKKRRCLLLCESDDPILITDHDVTRGYDHAVQRDWRIDKARSICRLALKRKNAAVSFLFGI